MKSDRFAKREKTASLKDERRVTFGRIIFVLIPLSIVLLLTGCGTKKKVVEPEKAKVESRVPAWHTCLIQGARATIDRDGDKLSATVTMQTVRDSMLVISVMPMLGMEMMRVEATPTEIIAIDKIHGQYAQATYAELNRRMTPAMNWDIIQQLCTAELPTGDKRARLQYVFGEETIELVVEYPERQLDVPVRVYNLPTAKYQRINISNWL